MRLLFCSLCLKKHETSQKMAGSGSGGVWFSSLTLHRLLQNLESMFFFSSSSFCRQKASRRHEKSECLYVTEGFFPSCLLWLLQFVIVLNRGLCYFTISTRSNEDEWAVALAINPILHVNEIHLWYSPPLATSSKVDGMIMGHVAHQMHFWAALPFAFLGHAVSSPNVVLVYNMQWLCEA